MCDVWISVSWKWTTINDGFDGVHLPILIGINENEQKDKMNNHFERKIDDRKWHNFITTDQEKVDQ